MVRSRLGLGPRADVRGGKCLAFLRLSRSPAAADAAGRCYLLLKLRADVLFLMARDSTSFAVSSPPASFNCAPGFSSG